MHTRIVILLLLILPLVFHSQTKGQEVSVKKSTVIEYYKGKPFYIHFVGQGETLTTIAKAYNVTIDEIVAENHPAIDKGLKTDMALRIPQLSNGNISEPQVKPQEKKVVPAKPSDDSDFILYTVKKQETLYGISKQYNLTVEDLQISNPGMDVLQEGMVIKIPKNKPVARPVKPELPQAERNKPDSNPDEIIAKTGETLYSIAKAHNTTIDELIDLNPQLSGGLKAGMVIRIRKAKVNNESIAPKIDTVAVVKPLLPGNCYSPENLKTTYKIALLLPFSLDNSTAVLDAPVETDPSTFENFDYMQFYAGFILAADSLQQYGLHANIQVMDADKLNDTLTIRQCLRKPGMDKQDLIVGPMYASSFTVAARFAAKNKIGIVNPLSRRESIVDHNPYVVKVQVSDKGVASKLSSFILSHYQGANIIAVMNDKKELKDMADDFKSQIRSKITAHAFTGTLQEATFSTDMMAGVAKKLKPGVKNIVILFSNNSTAVPNFVSLLNAHSGTHDITLFGMDEWDGLDIETEFLVDLNYHQVSYNFVDYESEAVQQFITRFRNKYGAVPLVNKHAFLGYDMGWYFLTSLMYFGDQYLSCLPAYQGVGLQYNFTFSALKPGDGMQNQNVDIIKLQDYKMVKAE
jgi:LysM repeat protein/ABC-type branched-subunit amino acid transport system substrate-binding protein